MIFGSVSRVAAVARQTRERAGSRREIDRYTYQRQPQQQDKIVTIVPGT